MARTKGAYSISDKEIIKAVDNCIVWMNESEENIFYTKYFLDNAPMSASKFHYRIQNIPELKDKMQIIKDIQLYKLIQKGMSAKNCAFIIFLMANLHGFTRTDKPTEVREEKTEKIIFKINPKPTE